jgi:predicted transglutaminase-like cysteine proteinase
MWVRARRRQIYAVITLLLILTATAGAVLGRGFNFDHQIQLAASRYGLRAQQTLTQWRDLLVSLQGASQWSQIEKINAFVNDHVVYAEDRDVWHVEDYWATPLETLGRGLGDCEDYAIAKYFSLLIVGIPSDQLRITYVKARVGTQNNVTFVAHMVLAYYPSVTSEPYILDSLIDDVRPASRRSDLSPVFGFNSDGIWIGAEHGTRSSGSSTARLSHWRGLIERMHAEGFE